MSAVLSSFEGLAYVAGLLLVFVALSAALIRLVLAADWARIVSRFSGMAATAAFLVVVFFRTIKAGRPPFASMYEFGLLVVLSLAILCLVLEFRHRDLNFGVILLPALLVLSGVVLLFFQEPRPLAPALESAWLVAHVLTAVAAYGLLAASFGLSLAWLASSYWQRTGLPPPERLFATMDRLVSLAFPFLTLLIITGAIWAQYAWGSFWRWDPKETWALITWILYLVYLHGSRVRHWKARTMVLFAALGFGVVLFTFFGVNLLLSGLHSYA